MKRSITLFACAVFSLAASAQSFWTENFGIGCNQGQLASAYTGTNGTWTISTTGANDAYADGWFVSATANGTGLNNCATYCSNSNNRSLHVGNAAISILGFGADTGSTYLTGFYCGSFGICSITHKRVESPIINCTNKTNINVTCLYYEGAELNGDYATFMYSPDGGIQWITVVQMPQTVGACSAPNGIWRSYSMTLPSLADNNPSVKIGFNWINDNDATGVDPSFAVDDIVLSQTPNGLTEYGSSEINVSAVDNGSIIIGSEVSYKFISVINTIGQVMPTEQEGDRIWVGNRTGGLYFVTIEINGTLITKKVFLN